MVGIKALLAFVLFLPPISFGNILSALFHLTDTNKKVYQSINQSCGDAEKENGRVIQGNAEKEYGSILNGSVASSASTSK
ncbi:hypothetical protein L6452_39722 [Arctium lappa]|uniref:Uncharacterized protein n=1 Tax=Arctium lappa TaxID=4217 RepID=A0ACB8XTN5_ARCLA|nr:hypothetical protein L6452_39722 [Arctium lappa]